MGVKSSEGGGCDRGDLSRSRAWRAFKLSSMGVCQSCSLRRSSIRSGSCCTVLRLVSKGVGGGRLESSTRDDVFIARCNVVRSECGGDWRNAVSRGVKCGWLAYTIRRILASCR